MIISCTQINNEQKSVQTIAKDSILTKDVLEISLPNYIIQDSCNCDSNIVKRLIKRKDFNQILPFDNATFSNSKFYQLDSQTNRKLWFRDIENPTKTKFTALWDAYSQSNYYASPIDFLQYYENRNNIELAFMFGPNADLWAYHIFIIKKINCCYLITRSYFRHNRFTYKSYSILDGHKLADLYKIISNAHPKKIDSTKSYGYCGYFMDNSNKRKYLIDFSTEVIQEKDSSNIIHDKPKEEILTLYNFVDKEINWTVTYE